MRVLPLIFLGLIACTRSPTTKDAPDEAPGVVEQQKKRLPSAYSSFVLISGNEEAASKGRLLPVAVSPKGLRALEPRVVEALAKGELGHSGAIASQDGRHRYAYAESESSNFAARVVSLRDGSTRSFALERQPAALMLLERALLVGDRTGVTWIDLENDAPKPQQVVSRQVAPRKAYDVFARDGDLVIAVDDILMPFFADSIRISDSGEPKHLSGFSMPGIINGSYAAAQYLRGTDGAGTLFALASYAVMSGHGQSLVALPMSDGRPGIKVSQPLNAARSDNPPVLEEHVPRQPGKSPSLMAGKRYTPITGLAVGRRKGVAHRVLVAAGERGLLVLPLDFNPDTRAEMIDLGAPVKDVKQHAEHLFALVGSQLVRLQWEGQTLRAEERLELDGNYQSFVQ